MDKTYWTNYYSNHKKPINQSNFAEFCLTFIDPKERNLFIELGTGNGRDSIYFNNETNLNIKAIDQCENVINFLNENYQNDTLEFQNKDFTSLDASTEIISYLYSRFTLHAITQKEEDNVLKWSYDNLKEKGLFFIEVRSIKDELYGKGTQINDNAFVTDHYRRFSHYDTLVKKLTQLGFKIEYSIEDNGLATYKEEDPIVIRIIAKK